MTDQSVMKETMGRIVNRDAKRLQIVAAAAATFAANGYDATAMDDVAEAAGVSKGSLYDYFKNKEDLFYAVFEWYQLKVMQDSVTQLEPGLSAKEQIMRFVEATVSALVAQVCLYPVTLEVWAAAAKRGTRERFATAMKTLYIEYRQSVEAMLRAAQESGELKKDMDAKAVAAMLVGAVDGLVLQYWLDPSFDPKDWTRTFFNALYGGIAVKQTEAS